MKQWSDVEADAQNDTDLIKKNGEDLSNNLMDDSLPQINPVKWTVCIIKIMAYML